MSDNSLYPLCRQWLELIDEAKKQKEERFGKYASETYRFYNGSHNWMWKQEYARSEGGFLDSESHVTLPRFMMTIGKVSDAVDLFGPSLIHQYPQVLVSPVDKPIPDPIMLGLDPNDPYFEAYVEQLMQELEIDKRTRKTIADHKQFYLNWLQVEAKKKRHARRAITEAIVKGMGTLYTELYQPRGSSIAYPRSRFISCDDLIIDPDARHPEEIEWIAVSWTRAINRVEDKFELPRGEIKGQLQSKTTQATDRGKLDAQRGSKASHDLITYYEVFSKNGCGQRMKSANKLPDSIKGALEEFGDFTYMAFAKGVKFPLNLHDSVLESGDRELMFNRAQWPIPTWRDDGSDDDWPVTKLTFKEDPNDVWGVSIFKPAIGFIRFCNWCLSFLADRVAANAADYIAVLQAAEKDIQASLAGQTGPFKTIPLDPQFGDDIRKVIQILNKPGLDMSVWTMVERAFEEIDKITGLTGLMYGVTSRQMRSATESNVLAEGSMIRVHDMASKADNFYEEAALKECMAAVWLLNRQDVEPVLGGYGADIWEKYIQTQDFDSVARDYSYRLAANSARKPDRRSRLAALTDFGQAGLPMFQSVAMAGQVGPWNWFMKQLGEAMELDVTDALLPEPPPPQEPDPNAPPPPPSPEELKAAAVQQKLQIEGERHQQKMQSEQERIEMEAAKLEHKLAAAQAELIIKKAQAEQGLLLAQRENNADLKKKYEAIRADFVKSLLDFADVRRRMGELRKSYRNTD